MKLGTDGMNNTKRLKHGTDIGITDFKWQITNKHRMNSSIRSSNRNSDIIKQERRRLKEHIPERSSLEGGTNFAFSEEL